MPPLCPPVPTDSTFPFRVGNDERDAWRAARQTSAIINSPAWAATIGAELDRRDAEAPKRGNGRMYSGQELESVFVFRFLYGDNATVKETVGALEGHRAGQARRLLGFDVPRDNVRNRRVTPDGAHGMDGVPSEATLCRHRKRFPAHEAAALWDDLVTELVAFHAESSETFRQDLRVLMMDGFVSRTVYRPRKTMDPANYKQREDEKKEAPLVDFVQSDGEVVKKRWLNHQPPRRKKDKNAPENTDDPTEERDPEAHLTAPDAGYVGFGPNTPGSKSGAGWVNVITTTHNGFGIAAETWSNGEAEPRLATKSLQGQLAQRLEGILRDDEVGVLTADGGFHSPHVRKAAMDLGYVPNISERSGSQNPKSKKAVAEADVERLRLVKYAKWSADGHQALRCECGQGTVASRINRSGRAVVLRAEGSCATCGGAMVTAGQWRRARNPNTYRQVASGERGNPNIPHITFALGNPLTFNHWYAKEMGDRRFGTGESGISHIANKYGFTKRRRVRTRDQVRVELSVAFAMQHAVALERQGVIRLTPAAGPTVTVTTKAVAEAGDGRVAA